MTRALSLLFIFMVSGAVLGLPATERALASPQTSPTSQDARQRAQDVERMRIYQMHLVELAPRLTPGASLTTVIRPMAQLADSRSAAGSPELENRAWVLTLGFYLYGVEPSMLVPEAAGWPRATSRPIRLTGREDLAKHFMISAAVSAAAGGPLAAYVGIYKEIQDTKAGGSGFSFTDLAADRAGAQFGLTATLSPASARRLQTRIRESLNETDMMPAITGLPEGLSTAEVNRRFGGTNGAAYNALIAEIDRRVMVLPLFAGQ